ncbi:MAG: YidC/Oxa1 family membrane protein insertase [Lachnospiraceae bacterium]|nr:YidC/Oxa1 family membrane protein insertase [Lachnospiraceae bacterium]
MTGLLLTQNSGFIIGPVAKLLGFIMEGIFWVLDKVGIPNIGLAIILFTIVIYLLMLPLTIKQQKFTKFSAKMNPELQAIQKKYQGKNDNDSMMKMQAETKEIYAKYGVNPTGSCLQLLIQMPILFALYRVIYAIPAYVAKVKEAFFPLVDSLIAKTGSSDFMQTLTSAAAFKKQFGNDAYVAGTTEYVQNTYIDVLNRASNADWTALAEKYPELGSEITATLDQLDVYNNFLGLNIGYSPWDTIKMEWIADERNWLLIIGAVAIPLLSALTQWLNVKLSPSQANTNNASPEENPMMASMKTMNTMMPLMSAFFCFTLPAGMGLYWIAGAVVRMIQMVAINKYFDSVDLDAVIAKNTEKYREKMKKQGMLVEGINERAKNATRNVQPKAPVKTAEQKQEEMKKATEYYNKTNKNAKAGSLAAKANMVKQYNEKNNK